MNPILTAVCVVGAIGLLGGGASLFKSHVPPAAAPCRLFLLDDVTLNAKGFERLCGQMSGRDGNG